MPEPSISIHLIVMNGEKYIRECLSHVKAQTYPNITFRVFDNASSDNTISIVREMMPNAEIIQYPKNYVLGGGFNRSLPKSSDPYVVMLCVDVMLHPNFVERAVESLEHNKKIGVVQAKIMRYDYERKLKTDIIDTTGLNIFRSRRVINRGHGEKDNGQYNEPGEIFCYEGAAPVFRREALEDVKEESGYLDEDFVWYADELDLGWRLRHRGWSMWYNPTVLAAHDRQTTTALSDGTRGFIAMRKTVPAFKRMLDFRNQRLTFIKNDYSLSLLAHAPYWIPRELLLFGYFVLFERTTLPAYWGIVRMAPLMLRKRARIMKRSRVSRNTMNIWFH